jgi:putative Holliday junction resolvase
MARWIGIDYGSRRIGVAICDEREQIVSPAEVLDASGDLKRDARRVADWAAEIREPGFVVGLPLNMDGSDGDQARLTRQFAEHLRAASGRNVELWDERLSSWSARELARQGGAKPRSKKKQDALAAYVILSSFLEARRPGQDRV